MKKVFSNIAVLLLGGTLLTGCMEEFSPQNSAITAQQAFDAPGSLNNFVSALNSTLAGEFVYGGKSDLVWDFGYPSFFLQRDAMGNDFIAQGTNNWFSSWYEVSNELGPGFAVCQVPWTVYYKWIKNCNTVLGHTRDDATTEQKQASGLAHAYRAMFYMDIARMYAPQSYGQNKEAPTVPIITDSTTNAATLNNPRATNAVMWNFILNDLDKAEVELADFKRADKYQLDLSVVYGLKARAYLETEQWAKAEEYAKKAQQGYTMMDSQQYTDKNLGFNTPNASWMFAVKYDQEDPCIRLNDGDTSWGSVMTLESTSGMGYASNYGGANKIDHHLYNTIPNTDIRKKVFIDFSIDSLESTDDKVNALKAYAYKDSVVYAESIWNSGQQNGDGVGGLSVKFRAIGGDGGRANEHVGFAVSVPLMRVEEMKLIEAEAAGRQNEARGIQLLTAFATARDPHYVYGKHNEAYGNSSTSAFVNEVWWQRRVELWGEGFATFDIKRLNKGIIRSYPGTNHTKGFRWNTLTPNDKGSYFPDWMNLYIIDTEKYNTALENNPTPVAPTKDSPEYNW